MTKRPHPQGLAKQLRQRPSLSPTTPRTPSIDFSSAPARPVKHSNTANMVAMYTIMGRQVGSHVVRSPIKLLYPYTTPLVALRYHIQPSTGRNREEDVSLMLPIARNRDPNRNHRRCRTRYERQEGRCAYLASHQRKEQRRGELRKVRRRRITSPAIRLRIRRLKDCGF
jgi:hypothetical protein